MEGLNKKVIFSILAVYGFLQMVFLLAVSVNFLLAETDSDSGGMSSVEITVSESGNRKDFQAISNMPLESVMFHFDNLSDSTDFIFLFRQITFQQTTKIQFLKLQYR